MNDVWSMKMQGIDGEITLLKDRIIITRSGVISKLKGEAKREIPYSSVLEVKFKEANALAPGIMELTRVGISSTEDNSAFKIKFKKDKQAEFARLKDKIYEILSFYARQK